MTNYNVGAVWFDDMLNPSSGWVSVNGSPAERIESISKLGSGVVWVTNLSYTVFRKYNLNKSHNLFDEQYFRTSMKMIAIENGLTGKPKDIVEFCSGVYYRVATLGDVNFSIKMSSPVYRYMNLVTSGSLPLEYRSAPEHPKRKEIQDALMQSTQSNQAMVGNSQRETKAHSFIFSRSAHAKWLLSLPYPSGQGWEVIPKSDGFVTFGNEDGLVIKGTQAVLQKLIEKSKTHAAFYKINVHSCDPFFAEFSTFGHGNNNIYRRWATLPEILDIQRYSKITIEDGYQVPLTFLDIGKSMNMDVDEFSYSRGLLLENIWTGLAASVNGKPENSTSLGAYLRAYDRIACNRVAEEFSKLRMKVGSYGTGKVVVFLTAGESELAIKTALKCGMIPSIHLGEK